MKFSVNDKVVPISKSESFYGRSGLNDSVVWQAAKNLKQPFLYVRTYEGHDIYLCSEKPDGTGDYFLGSDLIPYVGPSDIPRNHAPENKTFTEFGATFILNGPATVCIIPVDGRKFKGIAKCAPEDTWDESVGKGWAGLRAMQKLLKATEKNLKRNAAQTAGW